MSTSSDDLPVVVTAEDREADRFVAMLRDMVVGMVSGDGPDLSVRQLGALLACYLDATAVQTTSTLLRVLHGSRRGMNRALVRLEECGLVRLEFDPQALTDPAVHTTSLGRTYVERILESAGLPAGRVARGRSSRRAVHDPDKYRTHPC